MSFEERGRGNRDRRGRGNGRVDEEGGKIGKTASVIDGEVEQCRWKSAVYT